MESAKDSSKTFKITGNWADQSKNLKHKYSELTDADLKFEKGKEDELLQKLQKRLLKDREEVIKIIKKSQPKMV
jgi:uncharacterized protein YjbJ (UPF0337 family)